MNKKIFEDIEQAIKNTGKTTSSKIEQGAKALETKLYKDVGNQSSSFAKGNGLKGKGLAFGWDL